MKFKCLACRARTSAQKGEITKSRPLKDPRIKSFSDLFEELTCAKSQFKNSFCQCCHRLEEAIKVREVESEFYIPGEIVGHLR